MRDNQGFTVLECVIACSLVGVVLIGINRLSISAFDVYNSHLSAIELDNKADMVYYALKNRIENAQTLVFNTSPNGVLNYEDEIVDNQFSSVRLYYYDDASSISLYYSSGQGNLNYSTQVVQEDISSMRVNKKANSAVVTISYQFRNSDEVYYYVVDLSNKGVRDG
ncbi:MAG: hypothetical protein ATN34_04560 [Epulopiscium sp. Nele67-Bin002]|nr:MAG: hypothetical protein ATN34_04560 [Epulopiscium sp. Nele67-Bin002]